MTRGTFYLICDTLIIESIEFNGDMYPDGHGQKAIKLLEETENANDFRIGIETFNKENHNYQDVDALTYPRKKNSYFKSGKVLMTEQNYFKKFGSDWTFWKNISDETVIIRTKDKKEIALEPMEQVALNYGESDRNFKNSDECQALIYQEEQERLKREEMKTK